MRCLALASDYDGTIANHGVVSPATLDAFKRFRDSGRWLLLVTGREIDDLKAVFPEWKVFHWIVGENGAILYETETEIETLLCDAPPPEFAETLRRKEIGPHYTGRVLLATRVHYQDQVLNTIQELGLPLQIILNKNSLMVLPAGVDKATGLKSCLNRIGISLRETVAVGDAENDEAFLDICGMAVAVANALPALKEKADLVTAGSSGEGVTELIEQILKNDLANVPARRRS